MKTYLILDCNNLMHRSHHAMKELSQGATFGFLRDTLFLMHKFMTDQIIFCFDHGLSKRRELYPNYHSTRKAKTESLTPEEIETKRNFYEEIERMKTKHLKDIGFRNIFFGSGFEADDCIASFVKNSVCLNGEEIVIVSTDKDLYQLLLEDVKIYNPITQKMITEKIFIREWGIAPLDWAKAKAIAGCSSDSVEGVPGVGEKIACRYLRGDLNKLTNTYKKIRDSKELILNNLKLVKLPLEGTKEFKLKNDEVSKEKWKKKAEELKMPSLIEMV